MIFAFGLGQIIYQPHLITTDHDHFIAVKIHFIVFHIQAKFKKYSHVMHFFLFEMYNQSPNIHFMCIKRIFISFFGGKKMNVFFQTSPLYYILWLQEESF